MENDFADDKEFLEKAKKKEEEMGEEEFQDFVKKKYLEILDRN